MEDNKSYSQKTLDALEGGQIEESNHFYSWALRKDDDETLYNLAGELFALGFDGKALRIYKKLLKTYPSDDDLKILTAEILVDQNENDQALALLDQVPDDSEYHVQALMVEADLYQTEELFEVSERKLLEAYQISPDEPAIQLALGELYFSMQNYAKAVKYYLALIKQGIPEMSKINLVERLAVSYAGDGKFEKAMAYFEQIHDEDLTTDILMQEGITYLQMDEFERAQEILEDVLKRDNSYSSAYPYLIQAYAKDEQWDKGLHTAQLGLAVDQYNPDLYLLAAEMAEHAKDNELVGKYLQKAYELEPDNSAILIRLTDFYNRQEMYDKTIALDSNEITDPQLNWNLAVAYWQLDQFEMAQEHFENASHNLDNQADFLSDYYHFLRENGDLPKAVDVLRKLVNIRSTDVDLQEELEQLEDQGY